jgi:type IV pilus assembly protein PilF
MKLARLLGVVWLAAALPAVPASAQNAPPPSAETAAGFNMQLALEYLKQGNLTAAREKIERALVQNPKNPDVHTVAGLLFERLGEYSKADRHYEQAVRLAPRNPDVQNNYGAYLCRRGKSPKAEALLLQAARDPIYRTPEVALTNLGICLRNTSKQDEAEKYLREALARRPQYPDALFQMADLSFTRAKYLQGRAFLQRYLAIGPATPEVLWLGARLEHALGDAVAAQDYRDRLKREFPTSDQTNELLETERGGG